MSRRAGGRPNPTSAGLEPLLAEFAAEPRPAEEFVHDLHRRLRRRRTVGRLRQRVARTRVGTRAQRADERLRRLETSLGELRNRQLAHLHLEALAARAPSASVRVGLRRAARLLDAEVRERAVEARWLAQTSRRLLLPKPLHAGGPAIMSAPSERWADEAKRRYKRFRRALKTARRTEETEDLHALRQQLRRVRLLQELRPGGDSTSSAARRRADRTIAALGEVHDTDVLVEILRTVPTGPARTLLLGDLGRRRQKALQRVTGLIGSAPATAVRPPGRVNGPRRAASVPS